MTERLLKVYAERNTGTNYLEQLIQANLVVSIIPGVVPVAIHLIQTVMPGNEWIKNAYYSITSSKNLGWKHSKPSLQLVNEFKYKNPGLCLISITKNPYSWLLSLYKRPYHQLGPSCNSFEDFLVRPWKTVRRENCQKILGSPIELWNIKNRSYLDIIEYNGINLTYEGIVSHPESTINRLSDLFTLQRRSDGFQNILQCVKGGKGNFESYQEYYNNNRWEKHLSTRAMTLINQSIDEGLMKHYGYKML